MSANFIDTTADNVIIPEVWANESLGYLPKYLTLGRTVTLDSEVASFNEGDILHLPKRGTVSANQITENETVTVQKPTRTEVTVSLNNHWEVTLGQTDIDRIFARGGASALNDYIVDSVAVLAEKIEDSIAALHTSLTNTLTATSDAEDDLLSIWVKLANNNVPKFAQRFLAVTPGTMKKFRKVARATETQITGSSAQSPLVDPASELNFQNFNINASQIIRGTGSPVAYHGLAYTKQGFVLAMRGLPIPEAGMGAQGSVIRDENGFIVRVVKSYNASYLAHQVTIDVLFGSAVYDERQVVEYETTV